MLRPLPGVMGTGATKDANTGTIKNPILPLWAGLGVNPALIDFVASHFDLNVNQLMQSAPNESLGAEFLLDG